MITTSSTIVADYTYDLEATLQTKGVVGSDEKKDRRINILKIGLDAKNVDKKLEQQLNQANQLFLTLEAQYETCTSRNEKVLILMFKKI